MDICVNLHYNGSIIFVIGDATRLWNKAPNIIRNAKSIGIAKKEIKLFCKNLPI